MHIRVLLSKYRSYTPCTVCGGARLKLEALLWRLGDKASADAVLPPRAAQPAGGRGLEPRAAGSDARPEPARPDAAADRPAAPLLRRPAPLRRTAMLDEALKLLLDEIRTRLKYLCDVGLGYLTLDRQSRTLSGGEVQRINLTTALGTSLVNTLFVLDEPSIGLHPRDMNRIVEAMHRLRDAGNTLVVVEHDPAVMLAADRLIDMGPGPGERGGQIVFDGAPDEARHADTLTGAYLGARKQVGIGHAAPGQRRHAQADPRRRARAQPEERDGVAAAAAAGGGDGRVRLGQEHAGAGRAVPGAGAALRQGHRDARRARPAARRRLAERCGLRRPEPDRQDRALQPGQLRRRLGRDPQALRRRADGARAQLHRRHVQLQRRRRPLPDLRRLGLRACGDAVPQRRLPALPGLRRPPLPHRDPGREDRARPAPAVGGRRAGPHGAARPRRCSATTARWSRGCSRSSTSAWTTCAWASRCPRCRAARRSG